MWLIIAAVALPVLQGEQHTCRTDWSEETSYGEALSLVQLRASADVGGDKTDVSDAEVLGLLDLHEEIEVDEDAEDIDEDDVDGHFCGFSWFNANGHKSNLIRTDYGESRSDDSGSQMCFDDMCWTSAEVRPRRVMPERIDALSAVQSESRLSLTPACAQDVPANERVLLVPHVPAYHASTALEQVLMSSPEMTTLCSAGTWQCEGKWIINHYGIENLLETYSRYWDLSKKIFIDKRTTNGTNLESDFIVPFESALPDSFISAGITKINVVYLLMWRPICLSKLSSHAKKDDDWVEHEKWLMENALLSYHKLADAGRKVMVINIADVLFMGEYSKNRLQAYLPCLGELNFNFVPVEGVDTVKCNEWKAQGSVIDFAQTLDATELGYTIEDGSCSEGENNWWSVLHQKKRREAMELEGELRSLSRL